MISSSNTAEKLFACLSGSWHVKLRYVHSQTNSLPLFPSLNRVWEQSSLHLLPEMTFTPSWERFIFLPGVCVSVCACEREKTGSNEEGTSVRCSAALGASFFLTKLPLVPVTGSKGVSSAHRMNTRVTSVTAGE